MLKKSETKIDGSEETGPATIWTQIEKSSIILYVLVSISGR